MQNSGIAVRGPLGQPRQMGALSANVTWQGNRAEFSGNTKQPSLAWGCFSPLELCFLCWFAAVCWDSWAGAFFRLSTNTTEVITFTTVTYFGTWGAWIFQAFSATAISLRQVGSGPCSRSSDLGFDKMWQQGTTWRISHAGFPWISAIEYRLQIAVPQQIWFKKNPFDKEMTMSKPFQKIAELEGAKIDLVFISIHVCLCPHFACLFYHCPDRQIQATMQREEHRTSANSEKNSVEIYKWWTVSNLCRLFCHQSHHSSCGSPHLFSTLSPPQRACVDVALSVALNCCRITCDCIEAWTFFV